MTRDPEASSSSGHAALPERQRRLLRRAVRLEWITLVVLAVNVILVGLVAGQSQAMRAAWLEDMLSFLPPIAFLIAVRFIRRLPDARHPYGHHRAIDVAHLVAATALLVMGGTLVVTSAMALINGERPPVGIIVLFGHAIWTGWLMIIVMAITAIGPVILGRIKLKLAEPLHDKVLYADADMNKADWTTSVATIVGVLGIGVGLWWMDGVAAIVVALSIVADGVRNMKAAVEDLTDTRARTINGGISPLIAESEQVARSLPWVAAAAVRMRDQGHLAHIEMFVVPRSGEEFSLGRAVELREKLHDVDWRLHDVVVVPAEEIPVFLTDDDR